MTSRAIRGPARRAGACPVAALAVLCSCAQLTDVKATDVVEPEDLASAQGAQTLYVGAIGSFTTAFAGGRAGPAGGFFGSNSQIMTSGLISDEFHTASPTSAWADADLRTLIEPAPGPYVYLQRARIDALLAIEALSTYAPSPVSRIGHLYALAGYAVTFLGENICAGVPLGSIDGQRPVYGTPLSTGELFEWALESFEASAANAGDDTRIVNLARVGRGRALIGLGRYAEAAAAAGAVPDGFEFALPFSANVDPNAYYQGAYVSRGVIVSDGEGGNGLDFRSAGDPRVRTTAAGKASDGVLDLHVFTAYGGADAPITLASGLEARLIEAEAAYHADPDDSSPEGPGWLGILNGLRASRIDPPLPPLADPGSLDGRVDLIFRERAFWLFATGHRHGDLRRLVRQYERSAEAVFPTGINRPGISYGSDVTFTPDASQTSNPGYTACEHRGA